MPKTRIRLSKRPSRSKRAKIMRNYHKQRNMCNEKPAAKMSSEQPVQDYYTILINSDDDPLATFASSAEEKSSVSKMCDKMSTEQQPQEPNPMVIDADDYQIPEMVYFPAEGKSSSSKRNDQPKNKATSSQNAAPSTRKKKTNAVPKTDTKNYIYGTFTATVLVDPGKLKHYIHNNYIFMEVDSFGNCSIAKCAATKCSAWGVCVMGIFYVSADHNHMSSTKEAELMKLLTTLKNSSAKFTDRPYKQLFAREVINFPNIDFLKELPSSFKMAMIEARRLSHLLTEPYIYRILAYNTTSAVEPNMVQYMSVLAREALWTVFTTALDELDYIPTTEAIKESQLKETDDDSINILEIDSKKFVIDATILDKLHTFIMNFLRSAQTPVRRPRHVSNIPCIYEIPIPPSLKIQYLINEDKLVDYSELVVTPNNNMNIVKSCSVEHLESIFDANDELVFVSDDDQYDLDYPDSDTPTTTNKISPSDKTFKSKTNSDSGIVSTELEFDEIVDDENIDDILISSGDEDNTTTCMDLENPIKTEEVVEEYHGVKCENTTTDDILTISSDEEDVENPEEPQDLLSDSIQDTTSLGKSESGQSEENIKFDICDDKCESDSTKFTESETDVNGAKYSFDDVKRNKDDHFSEIHVSSMSCHNFPTDVGENS